MALGLNFLNVMNMQNQTQAIAKEKQVASSPLRSSPVVTLGDGTVIDRSNDQASLSPEGRAESARQRSQASEQRLEEAVGKMSPFNQQAARAAREECHQEAERARKEGRTYDETAAYAQKLMKFSHEMLTAAESPLQLINASRNDGVNVDGLGDVIHSGAEYLRDRDQQRQLEALVPKSDAQKRMAESVDAYIKG